MKVLTPERIDHLRLAAAVGQRMPGAVHTVHVDPAELAALIDRDEASVLDVVKIAVARQCACAAANCLHAAIRFVFSPPRTGKFAGPPMSVEDLEYLVEAIGEQHRNISRIVERGGREFLPGHAELIARGQRLLETFDEMLFDAKVRTAS